MASNKDQNRKDVEAARERDAKRGIVRVEVRVPVECRAEIMAITQKMRKEKNPNE